MLLPTLNRQFLSASYTLPTEKIIQFGGGNFLRAFVDWMVDQMNEKIGFDAGIVIVKPTPTGNYDDLIQQEGLFHVQTVGVEDGRVVNDLHLVKSVRSVVQPYQDFQSYLALAEQPNLNIIVSNTTEAGIVFENEVQPENKPAHSFPGKLTQLLYRRYQVFPNQGFVVLPCELIEKNGDTLRQCVLQYAQYWELGSDFEHWVLHHNSFCNTLVDRIVPGFPTERAAAIFQQIGVQDNLLVAAEPYHLWVIEGDERAQQRFPAHQIGLNVHFTSDLAPFRTIKVRLLNGAHTAMTMFGYLHGCRTVRACMEHPTVNAFVQSLVFDEILPTLPYPATEKIQYAQATLDRFRNPFVEHRLADIALNSISKFQVRLLPSLLWYLEQGQTPPPRLMEAFVYLIRFYRGSWENETLPVRDHPTVIAFFTTVFELPTAQAKAAAILSNTSLWGTDLSRFTSLQSALADNL